MIGAVVYGGFVVDLYELDPEMKVLHYSRVDNIRDDGCTLSFDEEVVKFVTIVATWLNNN